MQFIKPAIQFLIEIVLSAVLYFAFFYFNGYITPYLENAQGVNWIFIPAGLRIFLTLIFNYSGAIGLSVASGLILFIGFYEVDLVTALGIAAISGLAPLLGRYFAVHNLQVRLDLSNITFKQLVSSIVAYALLSSGLHQLWFEMRGMDSASWNHFIAMFTGDMIGSILFVAVIKYGIDLIKGRLGKENLIDPE